MAGGQNAAPNPRLAALGILQAVIVDHESLATLLPAGSGQTAKHPTSSKSGRHNPANASTSALVKALVYGTLRHYESLRHRLGRYLSKPLRAKDRDVEIVLLLGLFQLTYLDKPARACVNETVELCRALRKDWAAKVVNGVLRSVLRENASRAAADSAVPEHLPPSARYDLPEWLIQQLKLDWPQAWRLAAQACNIQAPMFLRVNALQADADSYRSQLEAAGMTSVRLGSVETGLQLAQACPVENLPGFQDGQVSVQDEAAQLCAALFVSALQQQHDKSRPLRLLDACAAPGGKTCATIEALLSRSFAVEITAIDISRARLERVEATFDRLGLRTIAAAEPDRLKLQTLAADAADVEDWWTGEPFDGILIDAPCSGTGVIRRHPDIKQLRRPEDIAALVAQQAALLSQLTKCLTDRGVLIYATCSILKCENDEAVARLLSAQPTLMTIPADRLISSFSPQADFTALSGIIATEHGLQLFAAENGHDGFFYSVIHRI